MNLQIHIEGAIIAAMAFALSLIPINSPNASFDLSLGLIPLVVYSLRRGAAAGMTAGLVWGLLLIAVGRAWFLSVPQVIFEYPFAFAFGGIGGLMGKRVRESIFSGAKSRLFLKIGLASVIAAFSRWFWHFWAGVVFWSDNAPPGMDPCLWSFIFNGLSAVANTAMLILVLCPLSRATPKLFCS